MIKEIVIGFFYKCFTEFSEKSFVISTKGLEPATQPPLVRETRLLAQRQQDACRDRIFKLNPIHASVTSNSLNSLNSVKILLYLGKTPLSDKSFFVLLVI